MTKIFCGDAEKHWVDDVVNNYSHNGTNERFLPVIRTKEIRKFHSQEASLDQVFNDITGVKLREID